MSFPLGCAAESMTSVSMGTRRGGRGKDEKFQWREGMKTRRKKKKVKEAARWKSIPWRDVDNPVPCQNTLRFFCLPSSPAPCISLSILPGSLLLLLLPSSFLPFHCSFFYSSPLHPLSTAGRYRIIYNVSPFWKRDFRLGYLYPVPGLMKILQIGNREPLVLPLLSDHRHTVKIPRVAITQFAGNISFNVYGLPELFRAFPSKYRN